MIGTQPCSANGRSTMTVSAYSSPALPHSKPPQMNSEKGRRSPSDQPNTPGERSFDQTGWVTEDSVLKYFPYVKTVSTEAGDNGAMAWSFRSA